MVELRILRWLICVLAPLVLMCRFAPGATINVACDGDDAGPGTRERPLRTLEAARDAVRKMQPLSEAAAVWLRGGTYRIEKTLEFNEKDSGTEAYPVVWRAVAGEEVRLSGAVQIKADLFAPVSRPEVLGRLPEEARGQVVGVDLKRLGITDFGRMEARGFGQRDRVAPMELFFNDRPMQLARWPNAGFATYGAVIDAGSVPRNRDVLLEKSEQNFKPDRPGIFS